MSCTTCRDSCEDDFYQVNFTFAESCTGKYLDKQDFDFANSLLDVIWGEYVACHAQGNL